MRFEDGVYIVISCIETVRREQTRGPVRVHAVRSAWRTRGGRERTVSLRGGEGIGIRRVVPVGVIGRDAGCSRSDRYWASEVSLLEATGRFVGENRAREQGARGAPEIGHMRTCVLRVLVEADPRNRACRRGLELYPMFNGIGICRPRWGEVNIYQLPEGQNKPVVGQWVHLAGAYDGETGKVSLYVNGKLIGAETQVGEIRLDQESLKRPLIIGGELNGPDIDDVENSFDGYIDDVRIFDRALSADEISELAKEARK